MGGNENYRFRWNPQRLLWVVCIHRRKSVGARCDDDNGNASGSVYIYEWSGSAWAETKIIASDGAGGDAFGWSVSIEGDRAIVGAYADDDNGNASGSVYIYDWNGSTWVETKVTASDGTSNDAFGESVSIADNRSIVGARYDDDKGSNSGSAYIYECAIPTGTSCDDGKPCTINTVIMSDCSCLL